MRGSNADGQNCLFLDVYGFGIFSGHEGYRVQLVSGNLV